MVANPVKISTPGLVFFYHSCSSSENFSALRLSIVLKLFVRSEEKLVKLVWSAVPSLAVHENEWVIVFDLLSRSGISSALAECT